jgi:uncharacterized protein
MSRYAPSAFFFVLIGSLSASTWAEAPASAHTQEIEDWRAERATNLKKPDSWLSLVGLFWLKEGDNPIGSADGLAMRLPATAPARLGVLRLSQVADAKQVELVVEPGVEVKIDGRASTKALLKSDASGRATTVAAGTISFFIIERGDRLGVRVKDSASPVLTSFSGIESYPINPGWRVEGRFVAHEGKKIAVPNVIGTVEETPSPGYVEFEVAGTKYRLDALEGSNGEVFLVFGDKTNGRTTYGGGRFVYAPVAGDKVMLDFNKAYNPPCIFTPYATCPLPPKQNRLALAIEAGEKVWGDHH